MSRKRPISLPSEWLTAASDNLNRCILTFGPINTAAFEYYSRLRKVKQYVEEHSAEALALGRVAEVAGMETTYFSFFFHRKVGVTYSFWVKSIRIAKAMQMMRNSNESIARIAYSVGFRDVRTFERSFKQLTHMNPNTFKMFVRPSWADMWHGCMDTPNPAADKRLPSYSKDLS
jgi:AraC-like DNA-binding protein